MPTYEYACDGCEHQFDLFQSIREPVKRKCPKCGKPKLRRLIGTGAAILFRGSGFHATDYRSDAYRKAADAEKKPAAGDSGTAAPKSESPTAKPKGGSGEKSGS